MLRGFGNRPGSSPICACKCCAAAWIFRWWTGAECRDGLEKAEWAGSGSWAGPLALGPVEFPIRLVTAIGFPLGRARAPWKLGEVASRELSDSDLRWDPGDSIPCADGIPLSDPVFEEVPESADSRRFLSSSNRTHFDGWSEGPRTRLKIN